PVHPIADGNSDRIETIQHIELGDAEPGDARMDDGAPQGHGIEPAAAAPTAGDGTELVTYAREVLAVTIEQLRREGTRADPRRVRLDDTEHMVEDPRSETGAGARKSRGGVG